MTTAPSPKTFQKKEKIIFVTVGTTQFEKLVSSATSKVALEWMERQGFSSLIIQYGRGAEPEIPPKKLRPSLSIQSYDFRPSLKADIEHADLVLSHAGAGTIMEVLRMNKRLVVVINTQLMNNHQMELAGAMADRGHLYMVEFPEKLHERQTWASFEDFSPIPHEEGNSDDMPRLLDAFLGFVSHKTE